MDSQRECHDLTHPTATNMLQLFYPEMMWDYSTTLLRPQEAGNSTYDEAQFN